MVAAGKLKAMVGAGAGAAVVLDAGCGTGLTGKALLADGFGTIDGVDLSECGLEAYPEFTVVK